MDDDYNCSDNLLNQIERKSPYTILLGGLSINDMEYIRKGHLKFMYKPKIDPVQLEQTLAKKHFTKFF